jgi:hypothetical protein
MSRAWPDMLRRYLDAPHESERPYCENEGEAIADENPTRSSGFAIARGPARGLARPAGEQFCTDGCGKGVQAPFPVKRSTRRRPATGGIHVQG